MQVAESLELLRRALGSNSLTNARILQTIARVVTSSPGAPCMPQTNNDRPAVVAEIRSKLQ